MRIAHFSDTFLPETNGVATSIATLAREQGKLGHDVLVFAPSIDKRRVQGRYEAERVRVIRLPAVAFFFYPELRCVWRGYFRCLRELKAFRPDVIHLHSQFQVGFFAILLSKRLGIPLVGTNHVYLTRDDRAFFHAVSSKRWLGKIVGSLMLRHFYAFHRRYDLCVTPSVMLEQGMRTTGYTKPIRVIPNGVRPSLVRLLEGADRDGMREKHGLSGTVVLHFGRLSHEKNVGAVLRMFALLTRSHADAMLLLIGQGPARAEMESLARELGIEQKVVFTGPIPHEELLSSGILSAADLFVTASAIESQGMVLVEAMFSGLPVVCLDAAAAKELIDGNGILTKTAEPEELAAACGVILADAAKRKQMADASLRKAGEFSADTAAARMLQAYDEAIRLHAAK
jgi:1,2-diacylglycerol 3-alpha-glucosyltransferase